MIVSVEVVVEVETAVSSKLQRNVPWDSNYGSSKTTVIIKAEHTPF